MFSPLINELIESLRILPGVGQKSAQRMAMHLLDKNRSGAKNLAFALQQACDKVGRCEKCRTFTEDPVCHLCRSPKRDKSLLCVVEHPADILALEQSGAYHGCYFVLMGHLSPIDGIGPEEIGASYLIDRIKADAVQELILATGTTVEGETTAYYIGEQVAALNVSVTRIAHGVPLGGDLEYVDGSTLAHALQGRRSVR